MHARHPLRRIGLAVVAATGLALLSACGGGQSTPAGGTPGSDAAASSSSGTFTSPSQGLGNGTARTYVTTDASGKPVEVRLRMTESALDGPPETTAPPDMLMLDFPDQASAAASDHFMMS